MRAHCSPIPDLRSGLNTRGFSLIGFLSTLAVIGTIGLLSLRIVPSMLEYWAIEKAIKAASAVSGTSAEMRAAYDKLASVGYIDAVQGKDLVIKGEGDAMRVSFAYEKRIPLTGPASLLIVFRGSTDNDADSEPAN